MSTSERVGAIDCGTNSIRLLIADRDRGGAPLRDLHRGLPCFKGNSKISRAKASGAWS